MNQIENAKTFASLHVGGKPIILYNAWDVGSAAAIVKAGAKAIATSSWAVAAAQGYKDGEELPIDALLQVASRIAANVDVPVTVDFEGGYTDDNDALAANIARLLDLGIVGINFEDRVVKGQGLYSIDRQAKRIEAIRKTADKAGISLFINARTDVFLGQTNDLEDAVKRSRHYASAGASGFFVPGLRDDEKIASVVAQSPIPVNVMMMEGVSPLSKLSELGVARVSYGNIPFVKAMAHLTADAEAVFS